MDGFSIVSESRKISKLADYHRNLQELDLDSLDVISAPKGFGKSNLSFYVAFDYLTRYGFKCKSCQRTWVSLKPILRLPESERAKLIEKCPKCKAKTQIGIRWDEFTLKDVWKYIAYSDDIYDKIRNIDPYSPICADEGVNFAMGEDWMMSGNKKIKRLFAQCRTKHLLIFINIPKFSWIQSKYRDDMATAWFRIISRGLCIMLIPDLGEDQDSWHLKQFNELLGSYNVLTSKQELLNKTKKLKMKHPCYYDSFWVPKIPDNIYKMYKKIRDFYVYQNREQMIDAATMPKLVAYNLRYRWKEFLEETKGRDFPSARMMAEYIFYNPLKKKPAINEQMIKNNITFMRKMFKENVG